MSNMYNKRTHQKQRADKQTDEIRKKDSRTKEIPKERNAEKRKERRKKEKKEEKKKERKKKAERPDWEPQRELRGPHREVGGHYRGLEGPQKELGGLCPGLGASWTDSFKYLRINNRVNPLIPSKISMQMSIAMSASEERTAAAGRMRTWQNLPRKPSLHLHLKSSPTF